MALVVRDPRAAINPLWGYLPPVESQHGLIGAFALGGSLEASCINHAGGAPARVIGAPTVAAGYLRCSLGHALQTEVMEPSEITLLAISRLPNPAVNGAIVGGTYLNSTSPGASLYYVGSADFQFSADAEGGLNTTASETTATRGDWWLHIGAAGDNGAGGVLNRLRKYPGGGQDLNTRSGLRDPSCRAFRIGDDSSATFGDTVDVALWVAWSRMLSADEADLVAADATTYAASRGLTLG